MNLKTIIVDLDSVQATPATEKVAEIEALANTIIQLRGLVSLPVIKQLAIDQYQLLSGELEFQAYVQAQQMDDSLPDRIMAFLADEQTELPISQQQEVLNTITGKSTAATQVTSDNNLDVSNLSAQIDRLSQSQSQILKTLETAIITEIKNTRSRPLSLLDNLNQMKNSSQVAVDIGKKLSSLNIKKVEAITRILCSEHQQFEGFTDVLAILVETRSSKKGEKQVKLLSEKRMLQIIDQFIVANEIEQPIHQRQDIISTKITNSTTTTAHITRILNTNDLSTQLDRLSKSQDESFAALKSIIIANIQDTIAQPLPIIAAFNRIQEPQIAVQTCKKLAFLGDKKIQKIIQLLQAARQKGQEFQGFADVMAVLLETRNQKQFKLVSDKKMLEMIDRWD